MINLNNYQKELLKNVVYQFSQLAKITDTKLCDNFVEKLCQLNMDDVIDTLLLSLNRLVNQKLLSVEDVLANANLIISLNPNKYHSANDLIARLNWLKSMNLEYPQMPLTENHKLVLEVFDRFNELIKTNFDCFYTGGLMGYLATGHNLERYHGDLDLFINEEQLPALFDLVQNSPYFEFVSNMNHKETHGHEYKIIYKNSPMSIGLFLFNRLPNQEVVLKEYYYQGEDLNQTLYVDEHHISSKYASMIFSNQIREHNGTFYKMQTLESIYNSKKNSRPKDRYDAKIIQDYIDKLIDYRLDTEKQDNYDINHKVVTNSIVQQMEEIMKSSINKQR